MVSLEDTIPFTDITLMQLIVAIAIIVVGWFVIRIAKAILSGTLKKTKLPPLAVDLLTRVLGVFLWVVIILFAVGALSFDTSAVVLGLSAVIALVLGWGLQDTFNNFAAGIWLAVIKPFDKNDYVEVAGQAGNVRAVGIMSTEMITPDNKFVIISNRNVWGSTMINYTRMPIRRVDVGVGTSYGGDLDKALEIAMNLMNSHPLVLGDPGPAAVVTELGDSSVNIVMRAWTKTEDFWTVKGDLTKGIFDEYNKAGIEIPFPQLDVHMESAG
jgi:small conductance mechanosensitive channel